MASPSPSHSWGDDSDALACLPSLPSPSSGGDVEGWGNAGDALANLPTLLSSSSPNGSDMSWGGAGDALDAAVTCLESLSDAWGYAGDALDFLSDSPSALQQEPIDLPASTVDADHWLNSDGEDDSGVQSPTKSPTGSQSPPQSNSSFNSNGHSNYVPSTDGHISNLSLPVSGNDDRSPRKCASEEDLFIGMELELFGNVWLPQIECLPPESILADPYWWSNAYHELSSVVPGARLHPAVLDLYLTHEWYAVAQRVGPDKCSAFYLNRSTAHHILSGTLPYTLRKQLLHPEEGAVQRRPVLFLQAHDDEAPYLLVLLDYAANKVFLFGRFGRNPDDTVYTTWNHATLWDSIADAFGWVTEDEGPSAFQLDWVQVCKQLYSDCYRLSASIRSDMIVDLVWLLSSIMSFSVGGRCHGMLASSQHLPLLLACI